LASTESDEFAGTQPLGRHDPGVAWLLRRQEPAIRLLTLTDVLDERPDHPDVLAERRRAVSGPIVSALLKHSGVGVYDKWRGPFWRLTALTELTVATQEPEAIRCLDAVLEWFGRLQRRGYPPVVEGRARAHAVCHGNALAAMVAMGRANDREAAGIARLLVRWQWPDGGWNCDRRPGSSCSSVHESLGPLWGLSAYHRATGDSAARQAAERAAELFLERRLFRSRRTGEVIHPAWLRFRHPAYYHYDVLQAGGG
jgi:hypothetical protein